MVTPAMSREDRELVELLRLLRRPGREPPAELLDWVLHEVARLDEGGEPPPAAVDSLIADALCAALNLLLHTARSHPFAAPLVPAEPGHDERPKEEP